MVQNTRRASPGSLSGGRSTMAENSQRSRGSVGVVMAAPLRYSAIIGRQPAMFHDPHGDLTTPSVGLPLAMVAAMAFALGGSANARIQHTSQVISLVYLPLTLWLIARALERSSWRAALAAGLFGGLLVIRRDQVALLSLYVIAGFIVTHCM